MNEELKVIITAEVKQLKEEVSKATKEVGKFEKDTKQKGKNVNEAFKKMGEAAAKVGKAMAKTFAAGVAASAAAIAALSVKSLKLYSEYEQLTGGMETLFGNSASIIKKYANDAYKTTGMSANQYMETVTSFSASLIKSVGGNTAIAAVKANLAITDMSDNANKMGTSLESLQHAYAGFAKGNFTMLDNLSLGFSGSKEGMEQLLATAEKLPAAMGKKFDISNYADIVEAIHLVQENMGIAGATAAEASTTIQGSVNMLKSSWENLLIGLADSSQEVGPLIDNVINSAITVLGNISPKLQELLPKISEGLTQLVGQVIPLLPGILENLLPSLVQGAADLVVALVQAAPQIIEALPTILPTLLDALKNITLSIVENLPKFVPTLVQGACDMVIGLLESFNTIVGPIYDMMPELITGIITSLIKNLPALIRGVLQLLINLRSHAEEFKLALIPMIPEIINGIIIAIVDSVPVLFNSIMQILVNIGEYIEKFFKGDIKIEWPPIPTPHFKLTPPGWHIGDLFQGVIPTLGIEWYAKGGVMEKPTVFGMNGANAMIGGERGAEAIVPLENNTKWLTKIADMLAARQGNTPIVLQIDGKTFARTTIDSINQLTKQTGSLGLNLV